MALQSSGQISLNQIHIEAGGASGSQVKVSDTDVKALIDANNSNTAFSDYYGASAEILLTSGGNVNGQAQREEILASTFISSGETLRIPSTMWIWSDNTSVAALTIDIPCTIINEGKIIGKGGLGGNSTNGAGADGGPAIKINSGVSNVTITNNSGAYIAGGGGGGSAYGKAGGGGGAGGGEGGLSHNKTVRAAGGALNAVGADGQASSAASHGGEAGGGGGYRDESSGGSEYTTSAGAGGRILPGTQTQVHTGGRSSLVTYGRGGAGGQAGVNGANAGNGQRGAGGGGWGAAGGGGAVHAGGDAGKAVEDSANTYTLNNSGTIYGATT